MAQLRAVNNNGQPDDPMAPPQAPAMSSPSNPGATAGGDQGGGIVAGPNQPSNKGSQGPADRAGDNAVPGSPLSQPRSITPPSPEAQLGGSPNATPKMPAAPTPVAAQPPMPFQPTPAPQPMDMVKPPSLFGGGAPPATMFGSQGGQLGGGMGVTGSEEGTGQALPSDLLFYLTKLLAGQK